MKGYPLCFVTKRETRHEPWQHSDHHSHPDAGWRPSALAAQRFLGYLPSGALGTVLIILVILLLMGRL